MKLGQEEDKRGGRALFGDGEGGGWRVDQRANERASERVSERTSERAGGADGGRVGEGEANRRGG